jgi:hypothetical protein
MFNAEVIQIVPSELGELLDWCYVFDKTRLISEAVRVVKSGGTIAFTDWISGTVPMTAEESGRFLRFMSFPNVQDVEGYRGAAIPTRNPVHRSRRAGGRSGTSP